MKRYRKLPKEKEGKKKKMRIKWQQSHIYQQPNLKSKNKNTLRRQFQQELNGRNGVNMEGY